MDWEAIEPVLTDLITSLAADPLRPTTGFTAVWKDRSGRAISNNQRFSLSLKVVRVAEIGRDDKRVEYVPEDSEDPADSDYLGEQRVTYCGLRRVTLQIETTPTEHTPDVSIMAPLERVRIGLTRKSSKEALDAVGVGVSRVFDAISATRTINGRWHAKARMDVELIVEFADTDPTPQGWIETVLITSHVKGSDGTELPVPPNYVDDTVTIAE